MPDRSLCREAMSSWLQVCCWLRMFSTVRHASSADNFPCVQGCRGDCNAAIGSGCFALCIMPQVLTTSHVCRVVDEDGYASEDTFYVTAEERVSLKMHNKNVPYATSVVRCQSPGPSAVDLGVITDLSSECPARSAVPLKPHLPPKAWESGLDRDASRTLHDAPSSRLSSDSNGLRASGPV